MLFEGGKRYRSYTETVKSAYGGRLQKLVVDAGFSCPNRDGSISLGGCTFCDNAAFHPGYSNPSKSITEQLDEGIYFHRERYSRSEGYLAYFQSFSNTYAPLEVLRERYSEALAHPQVCGIVVGTRPDCVDEEKLALLSSLKGQCRLVRIEFGIESCYDSTLERVNRGHDFECARRAVAMASGMGLEVGGHFILGLRGESHQMLLNQCGTINALRLDSVKFHQLQIIRGTQMEKEFISAPEEFFRPGLEEYIDFAIDILERLRPDLAVERIAGEVPPRYVSEAVRGADGSLPWGLVRNFEILRMLDRRMEERDTWQGRLCK